MTQTFNVYCDESCHLENDHHRSMVLGAVWCPAARSRQIAVRIREIKEQHDMNPHAEVKWRKVSPGGQKLYLALLDYFFDDDDLHFRALVIPDKARCNREAFGQDHDRWYYAMYFELIEAILVPDNTYRIYLDIKDTRSAWRIRQLHDVLANSQQDWDRRMIERVQTVRSDEVETMQLADLLIGAVSYASRGLSGNAAKEAVVSRMRERSGYALTSSTLLREEKTNIFVWNAAAA